MAKMIDVEHELLKEWSNSDGSYKIRAYSDNTYEIVENGVSSGEVDLNHWYNPDGQGYPSGRAVQHIENDIKDGYYPKINEQKKVKNGKEKMVSCLLRTVKKCSRLCRR